MALLILIVLGLAVWVFIQNQRIATLERKVADLAALPRAAAPPAPQPAEPPRPVAPKPLPEPASEPAHLAPLEGEWRPPPLVPEVPAARPRAAAEAAAPAPAVAPPPPPPPSPRPAPARPPAPAVTAASASTWLAENGLAWLGGGALTLGGLFLVVLAAQRGFFTPPMRIAAAIALGAAMIGFSEWVRRRPPTPGARHPLVAAALAGAGASTLYGAFLAQFSLYHMTPFAVAATLLAATSIGLLALALLHGEALAVLALFGAFLAPAATNLRLWSPVGLEAYLLLIPATGYAATALRRWGFAGLVTVLGAAAWTATALAQKSAGFATILILASLAGASGAVWARRGPQDAPRAQDLFAILPAIATVVAGLTALGLWSPLSGGGPEAGLGFTIALTLVAAVLAWRGLIHPAVFAAPAVFALAPLSGVLVGGGARPSPLRQGLMLGLPLSLAASALAFGRKGALRGAFIGTGAVVAALLATILWGAFDPRFGVPGWTAPAVLAALMAAGAPLIAMSAADRARDHALGLWIASAAEALFLAAHGAAPSVAAAAAIAAASLALAALAGRLDWRGLAQVAVAGGVVTLAEMLRPSVLADVAARSPTVWTARGLDAAGGAMLLGGSWLMRRRSAPTGNALEAESLATGALLVALLTAFYGLHAAIVPPLGAKAWEPLLETALRTDLMLAAGLVLATRTTEASSAFARWRLIAVVVVGAVHGLLLQGIAFNPWWGFGETPAGPPLLNTLALAYLAPAGLLGLIAWRGLGGPRVGPRLAAAAAFATGLVWAFLEIRHAFHPLDMAAGPTFRAEGAAYGLTVIAASAGLITLRRRVGSGGPTSYLAGLALPWTWVALAAGAWALAVHASPWWGPIETPLGGTGEALLIFALIGAGAVACAWLSEAARAEGWAAMPQAATTVATVELFVLLTLLVRWGFRGDDMHAAVREAGVETWAYSALWAAYGLAVLVVGGARRDVTLRWLGLIALIGTVLKVLLFDMARLDGVIRAGSFLAVGALLIAGALAARRLNADGAAFFRLRRAAPPPSPPPE